MKAKRVLLGKATRPSLSGILPRQRLFTLLDRSREASPVLWISGPPGCGKTTLAAGYPDHVGQPCLWFELDEGDADVATFFYYMGMAAAEHGAPDAEPLPLLTPEYYAGLPTFTRRYFQALFARFKPPFAIVFDGYYEIPPASPLHQVMRDALRELPSGGCVIFVSRGDPPPSFARLRANRGMTVIGWDDLRLTEAETSAIVKLRGRALARETLAGLYARTQGWAAGLVLLLEQARMAGEIAETPQLSTHELVFDYLAGEIFQKTDARTRELLLRSAYLPQMSARVAQEVSGDENAGAILAELHRNNYFVSMRQARPEPVYQYHPLFREFLRARAGDTLAKDERRRLQQRSAELLEAAGLVEDAIALYGESRDWNEMARTIERHAETMLAQGRGETLVRWVEELPAEVVQQHPWAVYWAAASRAQVAPRESRLRFEKAFELFRGQAEPERIGMVLACSGAMDVILYELDDFSLLDRWIAVLDEAAKTQLHFPSPSVEARVACSMVFSLTLRQPNRKDIEHWIERAMRCSQDVPDPNLKMFVGLLASLTMMWTGLFPKARGTIDAMRRVSEGPGVTPFSQITLKNVQAMVHALSAEREPCLKAMREGLEIARATGVHTWSIQMLLYGYGGALGGQDLATAAKLAKELEARAAGAGRLDQCLYRHFSAWEAMLRKDLLRALAEERTALRMAIEVGCPYFEVQCRLALAQIFSEYRDERKAAAQLRQLHGIVRSIENRHLDFTCLVVYGELAIAHGRQRSGMNALRYGFGLGRQYGYTHFLWWRPALMAQACVHALEAGIEPEYVQSLVRKRRLAPEAPPQTIGNWPWAFRIQTLGPFRLLRDGEPLGVGGKAQRRPMELLKVLIAFGGEEVSEDRITEALWPRIAGDSAHRSFTSTLHRLRKLLGEDRALVLREGRLTLDRRYLWVDAWAFEALLGALESATRAADAAQVESLSERLLELYKGPFLATDADESWYLQRRERLRQQFVRAATEIGRFRENAGNWERAREVYERCLEIDPLAESLYRQLMTCLQRLARHAEALEVYGRCRKVLAAGLHVEPSAETRSLYQKLLDAA